MITRAQTTSPPAAADITLVADCSGSFISCGPAINEGVYVMIQKHAKTAKQMPCTSTISYWFRSTMLWCAIWRYISELTGDNDQLNVHCLYFEVFPHAELGWFGRSEVLVQQAKRVAKIRMAWYPSVRDLDPRIAASIITEGFGDPGGTVWLNPTKSASELLVSY